MSKTASAIMIEALASYGDIGIAAVKHIAEQEAQLKRLRKHLADTMIDIACYEDVSIIRANAMKRAATTEESKP